MWSSKILCRESKAHLLTFSGICERILSVTQISAKLGDESCAMHNNKTFYLVYTLVKNRIWSCLWRNIPSASLLFRRSTILNIIVYFLYESSSALCLPNILINNHYFKSRNCNFLSRRLLLISSPRENERY